MKYCFDYRKTSKVLSELDEINIRFHPDNLDAVLQYIEEHPYQRINAKIKEEKDIYSYNLLEKFEDFKDNHPDLDFAIILPNYSLNLAEICRQKELKFFFDTVVRDWEALHCFIEAGVSDVYLVEQMMFEIQDAAAAAHMAGVAVRTLPNIAQKRYEETTSLKSFFIRPEDVDLYEGLVDVMELFTMDEINQDVVLAIYKEDKMWWGKLKELIIGLDNDIDNRYLLPKFGERRVGCNRKCYKGKRCEVCKVCEHLAKNLEKAGMFVQKKEEKENGKRSSEQSDNQQKNN